MFNRRVFLKQAIMLSLLNSSFYKIIKANTSNTRKKSEIIKKTIHSSKKSIPSIGMGTWLTFDVGHNTKNILARSQVLKIFFDYGGELIDSSPMYGTSERVLGKCLEKISSDYNLFSATKVWTPNTWHGVQQMKNSLKLWNINSFDLMQVHNLVNYEAHLENLFQLKEDKKLCKKKSMESYKSFPRMTGPARGPGLRQTPRTKVGRRCSSLGGLQLDHEIMIRM